MKKLFFIILVLLPVFVYAGNPPVIQHTPLQDNHSDLNSAKVSALITDDVGVVIAWLCYREAGQTDYEITQMLQTSGDNYSGYIPRDFIVDLKNKRVEYYIDAIDYDLGGTPTGQIPGTTDVPNSFTVMDNTPPEPVLEPESGITSDGKVQLKWYHSPSVDVIKYNIYGDNGSGTIDYGTIIGTVFYPDRIWTWNEKLSEGVVYGFVVRVVDSGGNEDGSANIQHAELRVGSWKDTTQLPYPRHAYFSVIKKGRIYIIGGGHTPTDEVIFSTPITPTNTVFSAPINDDKSIGEWREEPQRLPDNRAYYAGATYEDYVYVIGGIKTGCCNAAQKTAFFTKINDDGTLEPWQTTTPIFSNNASFAATVVDDYIYVIGGFVFSDDRYSYWEEDSVIYAKINSDGTLGNWRETIPLPGTRYFHDVVSKNGKIYVIGGLDEVRNEHTQATVFMANVNPDHTLGPWEETAPIPQPRASASAVVTEDMIYWTGGIVFHPLITESSYFVNSGDTKDTVWCSRISPDGRLGTWNSTTYMPGERQAHKVICHNDMLYIVGGLKGHEDRESISKHKTVWYVDKDYWSSYPYPPTDIVVNATEFGKQLQITWQNPVDSDFSHIRIFRSTENGEIGEIVHDNITADSLLDTDLENDVTYFYTLKSVDIKERQSNNTDQHDGMPHDSCPPASPANLVAEIVDCYRVSLSWGASISEDVDKYNIYWDAGSGNIDYSNSLADVAYHTTTWTSDALLDGTYKFVVRAEDTSGNEEKNTNVASLLIYCDLLRSPENLAANAINPGDSIALSWEPSISQINYYKIYRKDGTDDYLQVAENITELCFVDENIIEGNKYFYRVTCVDASGSESLPSNEVEITPNIAPSKVQNLNIATGDVESIIELTWDANQESDLAGYRIYRNDELIDTATTTYYIDEELENEREYNYQVSAIDEVPNEGEKSDTASGILHDVISPLPPSNLTGFADLTRKITLNWSPSPSEDIAVYSIYWDNATGTIDYTRPIATIEHPELSWVTCQLVNSTTYKFGIRAKDFSGNEEKNTDVTATISINIPGDASAVIKIPKAGKRLRGNAVTVMATATDDTVGVLFQYRPVSENGAGEWINITSIDSKHPFAVYWNVSALKNGEYNLRAVAYDRNNGADLNPQYITVFIDDVNSDIIEDGNPDVDPNKEHRKEQKISPVIDENIVLADGTEVYIPAGAVKRHDSIIVTEKKYVPCPSFGSVIKPIGVFRKFEFAAGTNNFDKPITITIPYSDKNCDGFVDYTYYVHKSRLRVMYLDTKNNEWKEVAKIDTLKHSSFNLNPTVMSNSNTISVETKHFTIFGLFYYETKTNLNQVIVYPNPCRVYLGQDKITFDGLTEDAKINIYTISTRLVNELETGIYGKIDWNLDSYSGDKVANGIYFYVITDSIGNKNSGKLAIVK